jgi:hypothetical protein
LISKINKSINYFNLKMHLLPFYLTLLSVTPSGNEWLGDNEQRNQREVEHKVLNVIYGIVPEFVRRERGNPGNTANSLTPTVPFSPVIQIRCNRIIRSL